MTTTRHLIREVVAFAPVRDNPELRQAYVAESQAVQRVFELSERREAAQEAVDRLNQEQDSLATRIARGADVTGADVRRSAEALEDAQNEVELLGLAIPAAIREAKQAEQRRRTVEQQTITEAYRPFREKLAAAEAHARDAVEAVELARRNLAQMPAADQARLDALLDAHGRDLDAAATVARWSDAARKNRELRIWNRQMPGAPRKLIQWPGELSA